MDEKIIIECTKGSRKAQKIVYETLRPQLMSVCMRYGKNKQQAEDYLHNGFIKLFDVMGKFSHQGSFEGWVRKLFVNLMLDDLRSSQSNHYSNEDVDEDIRHILVSEDPEYLEDIKPMSLIKFIQELPPSYRATFNLFVIEGYSHPEIAEILEVTVGTSKSNLSKAKENLKKILAKNGITTREDIPMV